MSDQTFSIYEDNTIEASLNPGRISPDTILSALQPDSFQQIDPETFSMKYRALSQSLVYQQSPMGQVVTDFSESGILRKSAKLLQDITIMADHEFSAGRYLGKVVNTSWTRKVNNTDLPGINAEIQFDDDPNAEKDIQRALRGVKKNYLNGFSVSVWFEYKRSHPDLDLLDFYDLMGTELDGELVRFIVTKVLRYLEASVVVAGADPHAGPVRSAQSSAKLAASFSLTGGWSIPKSARIAVPTNIHSDDAESFARAVEDEFMANRRKQSDPDVIEEEVTEETQEEEIEISESEDTSQDETRESENTVNVNISQQGFSQADLDAAVASAVAAKEAELTEARQENEVLRTENQTLTTDAHVSSLNIYWNDLKRDLNLAASFDELNIVGFMVGLSTDVIEDTPSQLDEFKAIMKEFVKFAKVPTTEVGKDAKEPHGATNKAALRQAAINRKLEEDTSGKRSEAEAMRLAAIEHPDLFREGD